jgi:mycothiol synthase
MTSIDYRSFRPGDLNLLVELIDRGMPVDPISVDWLAEYTLLDPNFDPSGLIIAEESGTAVGFVYAVRGRPGPGMPVDPAGGWITIGVVDPSHRRRGIGTELLGRAVRFLRESGAAWANYSGYPPAYFLPGLDANAYPEALRVFERAGFRTLYRPVAMDLSLADYRIPEAVTKLHSDRELEGYRVAPATVDDLPEVITFAAEQLAPDWGEAIRAAAVRSQSPGRTVLARDPGGTVIGFATYGAYRGVIERFGPFGVAEDQRGRGLGKILLHATMNRMRADGAHSAWFLWTGKDSPAGRLYLDTGFSVTRTFHVLQADLTEE